MTEKDIKSKLVRDFFSLWQQQIAIAARSPESIPENLKYMSDALSKQLQKTDQRFETSSAVLEKSDD